MAQVFESFLALLRIYPGMKRLGVFVLLMVYVRFIVAILERFTTQRSNSQESQQDQSPISRKSEEEFPLERPNANSIDVPLPSPHYPQGWRGRQLP